MSKIIPLTVFLVSIVSGTTNAQLTNKGTTKAKSSLEIGFDYSSNYECYGIFNNFKSQPNLSPSVSYSGKNGFSLSATGLFIGNSNASTFSKTSSELDLSGGWNFDFWNKALTISPSYNHFMYSKGAATAKSMYTDQTELDLSGSFKWFRPSITADYLFGAKNALNLNMTTGFNISWNNVFAKGNSLEFEPEIGTNYGDLSYSTLISRKLFQFLQPLRLTFGDNITIAQLEANGAINKKKSIQKQLAILNSSATLGEIFTTNNNYQINSFDLCFPLTFTSKNLSLYSELNISNPMNVPGYVKSQTVVFFSAGIFYSFDLQ